MYLLFQKTIFRERGMWLFTGTFPTFEDAERYAKAYFGTGTGYSIHEQSRIPLTPSASYEVS